MKKLGTTSIALASILFFFEANASVSSSHTTCGPTPLTKDAAKTCIDNLIAHDLHSIYNLVTTHNSGKHLGNIDHCTTTSYKPSVNQGSYFPSDQTEFNKVFQGATVECNDPSNDTVKCFFVAKEDVCFLSANPQKGGIYPNGERGKHFIRFMITESNGQLRTVHPVQTKN